MQKGRLLADVQNTILDVTVTLGRAGEQILIHEDHGNAYEVSTESNPSLTFYARKSQVEIIG